MFEKIKSDLLDAMKNKDKFRLEVIKMLKSALTLEQIEKKDDLTDDDVITVIKREVKKRNSSITEYEKFGKEEMVNNLKMEVEILSEYLPEEMSDEELTKIIDEVISETGASSMKDMGVVIKTVGAKVGSRADMGKVSGIVKSKLS